MKQLRWMPFLFVLFAGTAQAQQRHEFSAKQAVEYAQKNSAQIKNALLDVQIQEQTNKEITASAFPQINGNAGVNYFPNVAVQTLPNFISPAVYGVLIDEGVKNGSGADIKMPNDIGYIQAQFGTKFSNSVGVNLQQLLFDGQVFIGLQARNASMQWARKAAEVTEESIRANVYKIYYQLAASKSQISILDANIARVQKFSSDTKKLFENGFAEKLDISKLEVQLSNLQTEREKALNSINNGYIGLKLLIGMPIQDSLILTDNITYEDIRNGVLDASQYNYSDRKEYQYAELGKQLGEFNIRRYELSKLPTVSLSSNYNYIRQANKFGFGGRWNPSSLIGLNINVPIFSGFAKDARIDKAKLQLQQTVNNMEALKLSIDKEVQQAANNYRNALATLDNQKRNMELAQQVYDQTRLKFQNGVGSNTEISTAQSDLLVAQNNYILATYDAINAKIDYLKATGKLQ
ncbi:TolC family protein [Flavisolibacter nicotianae]|uniref:TolC family protein n=1 Tax=Flavisolibacter nicotianae TaxID=2364882 RepID=UPI000EAD657E|nr:TolC family protein [Flavisolibacter nicotianae]